MKTIAIIPARGGSRRVPRKNVREFHGKPMIEYAIDTAEFSGLFDSVVVSTDDEEIARVSREAGAAVFWRKPDDGSRGTQDVAREVLLASPDVGLACVIYPTSPLLMVEDLARGQRMLLNGFTYAMSVQADPLSDAGCYYWGLADAFRDGVPLIETHTAMVPLPANRVCDINTPADWTRAESMFNALRRAQP